MIFHEGNYMELPIIQDVYNCTRLVSWEIDQHRLMSVKWLVLGSKERGERQTLVNSSEGTAYTTGQARLATSDLDKFTAEIRWKNLGIDGMWSVPNPYE
jgi:hypothetical protein